MKALVWITQSEPGASRLAAALADLHIDTWVAPVVGIDALAAVTPEQAPDLVVVVSQHAVPPYVDTGLAHQARFVPHIAIGAVTATALAEHDIEALTPDEETSEGILAMKAVRRLKPGQSVWLIGGQGGRTVLEDTLAREGANPQKLALYQRRPLEVDGIDVQAITSIVAASSFGLTESVKQWRAAGGSDDVGVVAPSERVAAAARDFGIVNVHNAHGTSAQAIAQGLQALNWQQLRNEMSKDTPPQDGGDDVSPATPTPSSQPRPEVAETAPMGPQSHRGVDEPAEERMDEGVNETTATEAGNGEPDLDTAESGAVSQDAAPQAVAAPPPKPKGRGLAWLALLFALGAAGGVGYLYYQLVYLDPLGGLASDRTQLEAQYDSLSESLTSQMTELQSANAAELAKAQAAQAELLDANEAAVVKSLQEALDAAPPSENTWKLAEAEYLLRIANHRVLMEQDSDGALRLLTAADLILQELDDFALHRVRARLADEMIALQQVRRDDLQGVYLKLEAVKTQLANLPFLTPEYLQDTAPPPSDTTVWQQLYQEFKDFVRVRSIGGDEAIKPILAPEEERYVELNLRLALEQAQLAALRRHQAVFEHSLQAVVSWLTRYMDVSEPEVKAVVAAVDELQATELERPLPDISGSLNELRAALRRGAGSES